MIEGGSNNNGKEVVPNPGNGEQSKTRESRKRRSLERADAPSENTNPTKKPRTDDDHRVHLQVDDEILDEIDCKHKTCQPLGKPIPCKSANLTQYSVAQYWKYEPSNLSTIKKLEEKILAPENCEKICVPKRNREIFFSKDFQSRVKKADKRIRDTQTGVVKATAAFIKVSEQIPHAERENYVINTKEVLSAALDDIMLLGNVSHSLDNLCKEKLRPTLSCDLQHLCDSSNSVTSYLFGDDLPGELKKLKKLPETHFPRNQKDHTILLVTTTNMDILVNNQNNFKTPHHSPANSNF